MSAAGWLQAAALVGLLTALTPPLGAYMARVFGGQPTALDGVAAPVERLVYRALATDPDEARIEGLRARRSSSAPSLCGAPPGEGRRADARLRPGRVTGGVKSFFNVNSAMPFENATPPSNVVQAVLIVLLVARSPSPDRWPAVAPNRPGAGMLRTDSVSFGAVLAGVILMATLLNFFAALLLGPFAEGASKRLF